MTEGLPRDLAAAIERVGGEVTHVVRGTTQHPARTHLRLDSDEGALHGVFSSDPFDAAVVAHEVRVRELVGSNGALRAPRVLAFGDGWLLDAVAPEHAPTGGALVAVVAGAAARLAELALPKGPWRKRDVALTTLWRRRLQMFRSPLPLADLARGRRALAAVDLPMVSSHGYFHPVHVFPDDDAAWVIDWELSGPAPAGFDLLNYWTSVRDADARSKLFDRTVDLVGARHRRDLERLRYGLTVRAIVAHLKDDSDAVEARRLLALLPELRR